MTWLSWAKRPIYTMPRIEVPLFDEKNNVIRAPTGGDHMQVLYGRQDTGDKVTDGEAPPAA